MKKVYTAEGAEMTRYEKLKELIAADDFDMFALWLAITADFIKRACPAVCCSFRNESATPCKSCPSGWRWALREEIISLEDLSRRDANE